MLQTDRLSIERFALDDCEFIFELINEPSFKRYIGDKGIETLDDARRYLQDGPLDHYDKHGFGIYRIGLRESGEAVGMNGLVLRPEFDYPDLGFAFLRAHWSMGYAYESSAAIVDYAKTTLQLDKLIAMADEENEASVRLLGKLGFRFRCRVTMPGETGEVLQFELEP